MTTRRQITVGAELAVASMGTEGFGAGRADGALELVHSSDRIWNGVTTTANGRLFACFPSADGPGVGVMEIYEDGTRRPYPDAGWNIPGEPPSPDGRFVCVNSIRVGPDGHLRIVDAGAPGLGRSAVPGGARLIVVDLRTDAVTRIVDLAAAVHSSSYVDDVRFNGRRAYLTDAGRPGLIVVNLDGGGVRRLLDGHWSTTGRRDARADGLRLVSPDGLPVRVHADQLEVSPDGVWLYFQPACGPMAMVPTAMLDDEWGDQGGLGEAVRLFSDTPTTGGTAIDAEGRIYLSDVEDRSVRVLAPDGRSSVILRDDRLIWADAMWIDARGRLWLLVTQQHRLPALSGGAPSRVEYPVALYRTAIGAAPPSNDHA